MDLGHRLFFLNTGRPAAAVVLIQNAPTSSGTSIVNGVVGHGRVVFEPAVCTPGFFAGQAEPHGSGGIWPDPNCENFEVY